MYEHLEVVGLAPREDGLGMAEFRVSPLDCHLLRDFKWKCNRFGYIYRSSTLCLDSVKEKSINVYLHREIMGLFYGDKMVVDHLDGDPTNNKRDNLEVVTQSINLKRRGIKASIK